MRMGIWAFVLSLVVMASAVMAADPVGVGTLDDKGQYSPSTNNSATGIEGGHVYAVDIEIAQSAQSWAGIYGTITGGIFLGDSSGNKFFKWDLSLPDYIYITYNTDIDWSNNPPAATNAAGLETVLQNEIGWSSTDEPVDQTFNGSGDCGTGTNTIAALVYGDVDNDTTLGYEWPVCAYVAQNSNNEDRTVYAAKVSANGTAYNGDSANYQAIVAATSGGVTIHFYKQ